MTIQEALKKAESFRKTDDCCTVIESHHSGGIDLDPFITRTVIVDGVVASSHRTFEGCFEELEERLEAGRKRQIEDLEKRLESLRAATGSTCGCTDCSVGYPKEHGCQKGEQVNCERRAR